MMLDETAGPGAAEGTAFYVHPSAKGGQNLSDTGIGQGSLHCAGEGKTARWIETLPHRVTAFAWMLSALRIKLYSSKCPR